MNETTTAREEALEKLREVERLLGGIFIPRDHWSGMSLASHCAVSVSSAYSPRVSHMVARADAALGLVRDAIEDLSDE